MLQQILAPSENSRWPRSLDKSVEWTPVMGADTRMSQDSCLSHPDAADYLMTDPCVDYRNLTSNLGSRCDSVHFTKEYREI